MNYAQCLLYLEQVQTLGIKFGLENVRAVLGVLGNPEDRYASIVVAGSNGKGSVCSMLSRILTVSGYKAGLYTSPHLIDPEERIRINGDPVSRDVFCRSLTAVRDAVDHLIAEGMLLSPPTYFETMTCQALFSFAEARVDVAVLEVGMGGRFDATNVVNPLVSVITTISGEHQKFLGDTLSQIAFEKAGIIKPGVPVVCGVEPDEAYNVIEARAAELKAPFIPVFRDGRILEAEEQEFGYRFVYGRLSDEGSAQSDKPEDNQNPEKLSSKDLELKDPDGSLEKAENSIDSSAKPKKLFFSPSLLGLHQGKNAATAIRAAEVICESGRPLDKAHILLGIETTSWPGRLEMASKNPLIVMDGAHNEEGARALRAYADKFLPKPLTLVYAAMKDKAVEKIAAVLFPAAERIILTSFPYFKAHSPEELLAHTPPSLRLRCTLEPDPKR